MIPKKPSSSEAEGQQKTPSSSEAAGREDSGYLVTFLIDENTGTSECAILDASDVAKGPICRLALPHKICSGTHSVWVEHDQLRADAAFHAGRFAAA